MKEIILLGAGGHANSCIDVIEAQKNFKTLFLVGKKILKNKSERKIKIQPISTKILNDKKLIVITS